MSQSAAQADAPPIVAPSVRDLDELAASLGSWLGTKLPDARGINISNLAYPRGAGMSHETILFDADWTEGGAARAQGLVVRIKPTTETMFLDDMFDQQYQLMRLMHESGKVKVAKVLWLEHDASLLGAPFFVMEKKHGRVAVTYPPYSKVGWLFDSKPADRRRMWEDGVRQLASIQLVPPAQAPFLALPSGGTGAEQEVDRWRRYMNWMDPKGERHRLRGAFDRLLSIMPADSPEGIVWGDARLGNMMVGDDYLIAAVMDWEQPSLGGALHDLGWWLHTDYNQTVGQGLPPLEGMGTRDETLALWQEVSGKSAANIRWHEAFASFKMDCLSIRTMMLREMPGGARMAEPGTRTEETMKRHGL